MCNVQQAPRLDDTGVKSEHLDRLLEAAVILLVSPQALTDLALEHAPDTMPLCKHKDQPLQTPPLLAENHKVRGGSSRAGC